MTLGPLGIAQRKATKTTRTKIAILLPDLRGGGAERMRIHLAEAFLEAGYSVDFVLLQARGELLAQVPQDARIVDLAGPSFMRSLWPLVRYLRRERPDGLLAAMWAVTVLAILAHRFARVPGRVIVSDHSILSKAPVTQGRLRQIILRVTVAFAYRLADERIGVSKGVAEDVKKLGHLPNGSMRVIYNPAAIQLGHLPPASSDPWEGMAGYRVLSVGTLKAVKDQVSLIRAFAQVRQRLNSTLVILGEGGLRPELERLIRSLGLEESVRLPGFVMDPHTWYQGADLFVLSSRYEGFGNVIVEALQHGLPVVSTDCPSGPSEILQDGQFGTLVPLGNIDALSDAIEEALCCEHDHEALRTRAQDFTVDRIAEQYLSVLFPNQRHHVE